MGSNIVSIRKLRMDRDQDLFIRMVLDDPARLARVRAYQIERYEERERQRRKEEDEAKRKKELGEYLMKFSVGLAFICVFASALAVFAL